MDSEIIYHGLAWGKGFPAAFASTSLGRDYEAWSLFFLPGTLKTARDSASRSARQKKSQLCTSCLLVFQALSWFCMSGYALIDVDSPCLYIWEGQPLLVGCVERDFFRRSSEEATGWTPGTHRSISTWSLATDLGEITFKL